jgi:hypothetical protein
MMVEAKVDVGSALDMKNNDFVSDCSIRTQIREKWQ